MKRSKRIAAWLVCIGLLAVLFASSAYIACEADHDCAGDHCEICENILHIRALLHSFALLGVVLLAVLVLLAVHRACRSFDGLGFPARRTLVSWKIRLND